jgi:hypothetical protein
MDKPNTTEGAHLPGKTIYTTYPDLKPATTLRELFEQFEKQIKLPNAIVNRATKFSSKNGKPTKFEGKPEYPSRLVLAKTSELNGVSWGVNPSLKATNKVYAELEKGPNFFQMENSIFSVTYRDDDGYKSYEVSKVRPQRVA